MADIEHFIITQLDQAGIAYSIRRDFINVGCVYHEHSGRNKKLGFSRHTGGMSCFVCGKKGHWNEFAKELGLEQVRDNDARLQDFSALRHDFDRAMKGKAEPTTPDWLLPWERPRWRRLPREFIISIPSFEWFDTESDANRILWPVYINDRFKGCTSARIKPQDENVWPKTRNLGGLDAQKVLFPFDHPLVRAAKIVVLVEGVFDALRLIYHGIPAVSILGAGAWDPHKLDLLALRGVERLVLAFDGDKAGEDLGDLVLEPSEALFDTRVFIFPNPTKEEKERGIKSIDPGNCGPKYLRILRRLCEV